MGVDLQKEIKLSDLFRKREKAPKEEKPKREKRKREQRPKDAAVAAKAAPDVPQIPLMRAFDLMPKAETREQQSRFGLAQVLVALVGLLAFAVLAGAFLLMDARATERQSRVDELRGDLAALEVPAETPAGQAGPELASTAKARTTSLAGALSARIAWDRVLREFSLVLPEDVWLTELSATVPTVAPTTTTPATGADPTAPNTFAIVGFAKSQEGVARLLSRLNAVPEFASVQLQSSARASQTGQTTYSFSIVAAVTGGVTQ